MPHKDVWHNLWSGGHSMHKQDWNCFKKILDFFIESEAGIKECSVAGANIVLKITSPCGYFA